MLPVQNKAEITFPVEYATAIRLGLETKLIDITPEKAVLSISAIISMTFTISGQQTEPKQLAYYSDEFYSKLIESYPQVTIGEVKFSLRSGVYGEFGDYFGLNPKTFVFFIRSYLQSNQRKEAIESYRRTFFQIRAKPLVVSPDEQEKDTMDFVNYLFEIYLRKELVWEYLPSFVYHFLVQKQKINLTKDEKLFIYEEAKKKLRTKAQTEYGTFLSQRQINNLYGDQEEQILKLMCYQISVKIFFEKQNFQCLKVIF